MELCFRGRRKGNTFLGYLAASGLNSTAQTKGVNDFGFLMPFLPLAPISFQITAPVPPPRPSPTLGTALWGSCQGPVSGFLPTASSRAGEVASWRSSLPSAFLPLLSSFLPQPFARPTLASGVTGSAIPFRSLFSSSATWRPKWGPLPSRCFPPRWTHSCLW